MTCMKGKEMKRSFTHAVRTTGRKFHLFLVCSILLLTSGFPLGDSTLHAAAHSASAGERHSQAAAQAAGEQSAARKGMIWRAEHKWATEEGYNWTGIESDLQEMKNAGVSWIRIAFWEAQPLSYYDRLIPLIGQYDIQILGNIRKSYPEKDLGTPAELEAYRNWLSQVVTHYQGVVRYWEVENETNISSGWNICLDAACEESDPVAYAQAVEKYVQLLKLAYETIKAVDPSLQVLIGGLCECGAERYLDELIRLDAQRYFDIMAYHPFGRSPEEVIERLDTLKAKTASQPALAAKPIWITAIGFHTADWKGTPGRVASEEVKAEYLLQTMALLSQADGVEGPIFWYILSEPIAPVNGYGLIFKDANVEPIQAIYLPAYSAYQELWTTKYVQVSPAIEDCYVSRNYPQAHNGDSQQLKIGSGTDVTQAYVKFDLTGLAGSTLLQTELRFQTSNNAEAGSQATQTIKVYAASNWTGDDLTGDNDSLPIVGTVSNTVEGTGYQVPLDEAILQHAVGGQLVLTLDSTSADELMIQSSEWKSSLRLIVYYSPPAPTATAVDVLPIKVPCGESAPSLYLPFAGR